jgi:futalosine hydrolase
MRILLHSATQLEVDQLLPRFENLGKGEYRYNDQEIKLLISGVGMMATAYHMGKILTTGDFDIALSVGICGSFDKSLELGQAVFASSDLAIEEGAENGDQWLSLQDMKLREADDFPYEDGLLRSDLAERFSQELNIPLKQAVSVNRVLGSEGSIKKVQQHFNAEIVSMEGAAFYFACSMKGLPAAQLRTVSNYVENRNRSAWKVEEALANLAETSIKLLKHV